MPWWSATSRTARLWSGYLARCFDRGLIRRTAWKLWIRRSGSRSQPVADADLRVAAGCPGGVAVRGGERVPAGGWLVPNTDPATRGVRAVGDSRMAAGPDPGVVRPLVVDRCRRPGP